MFKYVILVVLLIDWTNAQNLQLGLLTCLQYPCLNQGRCQFNAFTDQVNCVCPPNFSGRFCEINLANPSLNGLPPWVTTTTNRPGVNINNICFYTPNLCKNGGQCLMLGESGVKCECPILYTGAFCEILQYVPCPTQQRMCNRLHGDCNKDKKECECYSGWNGPRCDTETKCYDNFCLNGGTCDRVDNKLKCSCRTGFSGDYCQNGPAAPTPSLPVAPRTCANYTIRILNTGAFPASFILSYNYDTVRQEERQSPTALWIGSKAELNVLVTDKLNNLKVKLIAGGRVIYTDSNLGYKNECIKCYKFWGSIFGPKWDHIYC